MLNYYIYRAAREFLEKGLMGPKSVPREYIHPSYENSIDNKVRRGTQEEAIRQYLTDALLRCGFSRDQVSLEFPVSMGSRRLRVDVAVFPKGAEHLQENIIGILEIKRWSVEPKLEEAGVKQLKSYMASCLNCQWGLWGNGRKRRIFLKKIENGAFSFVETHGIPAPAGAKKSRTMKTKVGGIMDKKMMGVVAAISVGASFVINDNAAFLAPLAFGATYMMWMKQIMASISDEPPPLSYKDILLMSKEDYVAALRGEPLSISSIPDEEVVDWSVQGGLAGIVAAAIASVALDLPWLTWLMAIGAALAAFAWLKKASFKVRLTPAAIIYGISVIALAAYFSPAFLALAPLAAFYVAEK